MTKNAARGILILLILLAVFSVIVFAIPFSRNMVFWIAYSCGVFAILFQLYIFKTSFGSKADARSRFYGFPIARLGIYYLAIQLIVSIIEIVFSGIVPVWAVIIINVLILAFALIGCITTETMRDEIVRQDMQLKKDVSNMRELQSLSSALVNQCNDEETKKILQKVAEDFRYSDPVSSDQTKELEAELKNRFAEIQQAVVDGDTEAVKSLCIKLSGCLAERNRICSISK